MSQKYPLLSSLPPSIGLPCLLLPSFRACIVLALPDRFPSPCSLLHPILLQEGWNPRLPSFFAKPSQAAGTPSLSLAFPPLALSSSRLLQVSATWPTSKFNEHALSISWHKKYHVGDLVEKDCCGMGDPYCIWNHQTSPTSRGCALP